MLIWGTWLLKKNVLAILNNITPSILYTRINLFKYLTKIILYLPIIFVFMFLNNRIITKPHLAHIIVYINLVLFI